MREGDLGFILEVELTGLGNRSMWVAGGRRIQGCLPVFWPEQLGGRWCRFLRRGRYKEEQVGEEIESLLSDALGVSCSLPLPGSLLMELRGPQSCREARGRGVSGPWVAPLGVFEARKLLEHPLSRLGGARGHQAFPVPGSIHFVAQKDRSLGCGFRGEAPTSLLGHPINYINSRVWAYPFPRFSPPLHFLEPL